MDQSTFIDRIVYAVSANEGSFTSINHDDAGYGWSVGMRQWNQKVGELPDLIRGMCEANPSRFQEIFGHFAKQMAVDGHIQETWLRTSDFNALGPEFEQAMIGALTEFKEVQIALSRQFVRNGISLARRYGFKSELGWAHVCDVVNQKGYGGAEKCLKTIGGAGNDEEKAIESLENVANRPGGERRLASLAKTFSANSEAVV